MRTNAQQHAIAFASQHFFYIFFFILCTVLYFIRQCFHYTHAHLHIHFYGLHLMGGHSQSISLVEHCEKLSCNSWIVQTTIYIHPLCACNGQQFLMLQFRCYGFSFVFVVQFFAISVFIEANVSYIPFSIQSHFYFELLRRWDCT